MGVEPVLRHNDTGDAVRDLQARLVRLGLLTTESGVYDTTTEQAVEAFQRARGLRASGHCERETWAALYEAGFRIGDRLLYQRRPMLRGDDIAELQRRLNALGFHAGREDGIFGPATERALSDFQLNAGLAADGVLGPESRSLLERLGALAAGSVATVRERESLRRDRRRLRGCRIFVAIAPGLDVLGESIARGLALGGAHPVADRSGRDDHIIARAANEFDADAFLSFRTAPTHGARCTYFANQSFRSEAGYNLATSVDRELARVLGPAPMPEGRAYALLRETRMAAVVCEPVAHEDVAAMRHLVSHAPAIAEAIVEGVRLGIEEPVRDH